jgi:plasmid maintenance system antidote protein VapI
MRINKICNGTAGISAGTAVRLARYLGTSQHKNFFKR